MTWDDAIALATKRLKAAGIEAPQGDVDKLRKHAFPRRYADYNDIQDGTALDRFWGYVARRENREPMAHILGGRYFWNHRFKVTADVLDPRPDTETLVELALSEPFDRVLDLGTGSGCIVISVLAERRAATGVGTDISDAALAVAAQNIAIGEVETQLTLLKSDWFSSVTGTFDLIVSNPPYIAASEMADLQPEVRDFEPHLALTDQNDGLSAYRTIAADAPRFLTPGGRLLVETGFAQADAVTQIFKGAGLENIACQVDLAGKHRVVSARSAK